jgi:phosphoribosylformylglycinamidine synthase
VTRVEVFIQLKPGMLDPQGETLTHALEALGYDGVSDLRVGKWITFRLEESDSAVVDRKVEEMCERLLANPVIERFDYRIHEDGR